jgi:hypothetical protein
MKGRRPVKEGFLGFDAQIVYVCHSKDLHVFEQGMVVGARHTGLIVSRTAMLLDRLGRYTVYRGIWEKGHGMVFNTFKKILI